MAGGGCALSSPLKNCLGRGAGRGGYTEGGGRWHGAKRGMAPPPFDAEKRTAEPRSTAALDHWLPIKSTKKRRTNRAARRFEKAGNPAQRKPLSRKTILLLE